MSATGTLPPQAYTRDVLVKAYEWFSTQPAGTRERAPTADALVAMYLQAKRRAATEGNGSAWDQPTPATVEAFKADLRHLAEGLRQFEDPIAPPHISQPASAAPFASPKASAAPEAPAVSQRSGTGLELSPLDLKSQTWIREVRERLNLSSDGDAMRALISIGYGKLKDLLP